MAIAPERDTSCCGARTYVDVNVLEVIAYTTYEPRCTGELEGVGVEMSYRYALGFGNVQSGPQ